MTLRVQKRTQGRPCTGQLGNQQKCVLMAEPTHESPWASNKSHMGFPASLSCYISNIPLRYFRVVQDKVQMSHIESFLDLLVADLWPTLRSESQQIFYTQSVTGRSRIWIETEVVSYQSCQGQTLGSCQKPCSELTHNGRNRAWISPCLLPEFLWALCGTLLVDTQAGWPEDTMKARICSSDTCPGVVWVFRVWDSKHNGPKAPCERNQMVGRSCNLRI